MTLVKAVQPNPRSLEASLLLPFGLEAALGMWKGVNGLVPFGKNGVRSASASIISDGIKREQQVRLVDDDSGKPRRGDPRSAPCTAIADLPHNAHLDAAALAKFLGRCKKSVQRAVRRGELPKPFVLMGRQMWLAGVIIDHLKARQNEALSRAARQNGKLVGKGV